jgi:hypothetical protein
MSRTRSKSNDFGAHRITGEDRFMVRIVVEDMAQLEPRWIRRRDPTPNRTADA